MGDSPTARFAPACRSVRPARRKQRAGGHAGRCGVNRDYWREIWCCQIPTNNVGILNLSVPHAKLAGDKLEVESRCTGSSPEGVPLGDSPTARFARGVNRDYWCRSSIVRSRRTAAGFSKLQLLVNSPRRQFWKLSYGCRSIVVKSAERRRFRLSESRSRGGIPACRSTLYAAGRQKAGDSPPKGSLWEIHQPLASLLPAEVFGLPAASSAQAGTQAGAG